jgi:GDP-L-fucose synthase
MEVLGISSREADLRNYLATKKVIGEFLPDVIIDAAAKVGGVGANIESPVDFLEDNLLIQTNLMQAAKSFEVERFVFLGSSCIYPRNANQPISESALLSSELEPTNKAYAIAKIAGIVAIDSYFQQYNKHWFSVMPCNLYGENDNFDKKSGHVVASLVSKFCDAVLGERKVVEVWGSGNPRREFMYADDLPEAILLLLQKHNGGSHFNVGYGEDISIRNLVSLIVEICGYEGEVVWNSSKPDGIYRKLLDSSRVRELGWRPSVNLKEGLERVIKHYFAFRTSLRGVSPDA